MALKVLHKTYHNGVIYSKGEIIADITKAEAKKFVCSNIGIIIDDKFKKQTEKATWWVNKKRAEELI